MPLTRHIELFLCSVIVCMYLNVNMFEKCPSFVASRHISHGTEAHSLTAWSFVHEYCVESGFVFSFVILNAGVQNGQITIQVYHE
jgi:hypothetical protein